MALCTRSIRPFWQLWSRISGSIETYLSDSERTDHWSWKLETDDRYTIRSAYRQLATSGSLPTCAQLVKRHVVVSVICLLCQTTKETIFHALIGCSYARAYWSRTMVDIGNVLDDDFYYWLLVLAGRGKAGELEELAMVACAIRKAKNDFV
ncbi:hypothetical protein F8388_014231 [Cannabis sativa]|uniref:Reverse transcriptase zinc-binding domain-containing protein n=1 Tax=Cannabis sativa TaxID=3483 RepID=A0A7J6GQR7_CANSA|nr:hypothetical protein G4B88_018231 [Cannabis sativa]KAF4385098.1 hypothetical protein F8388_014231 [Cannabis sativa]